MSRLSIRTVEVRRGSDWQLCLGGVCRVLSLDVAYVCGGVDPTHPLDCPLARFAICAYPIHVPLIRHLSVQSFCLSRFLSESCLRSRARSLARLLTIARLLVRSSISLLLALNDLSVSLRSRAIAPNRLLFGRFTASLPSAPYTFPVR